MSKLTLLFQDITLTLLLLHFICLPLQVISQTTITEQIILLNVKEQLGNPPSIQSWNSSSSPCDWPEISCSGGTVTGVLLGNKGINKTIPPTLCNLENLTELDLAYNDIPGEFPRLVYNCSKLQMLNLSQNYFVGPIPEDVYRLHALRFLDLSGNNFSGDIPPAIGKLTELQTLNLNQNEFDGTFPKEIGILSNLEYLAMAYNYKFVPMVIPPEFGNLRKLKVMWIKNSNLMGEIPQSFSNLTSLEWLDLSMNSLTGKIPKGLFLLSNLSCVYLFNNRLSGEIPSSVEALNLNQIDLAMNNLTGSIPESVGKLKSLTVLSLYMNQLTGQIPLSVGKIPSLMYFKVFSNNLNGTLPPELGRYSMLKTVEVSDNQLTGELPPHLCNGGALQGVVAFSNKLSGLLPEGLGNCTALRTIQVYNNNFSGELPFGVWTLWNLSSLMLSRNSFSGQLPDKFAWNLSRLEIDNNKFSGSIPAGISSAVNLSVFIASNNLLSGEIPLELTYLCKLSVLMLDRNQLSGALPSEIVSWKSLTTLTLSRNNLSAQIPIALCKLPILYLDLSDNKLSGEIPPHLGQLRLASLNLSFNNIFGKVPKEFDNLAYESSFKGNPSLCADDIVLGISICHTELSQSSKSSSRALALILSCIIVTFMATVSSYLYWLLRNRNKNQVQHSHSTWKVTSFHRLDLSEWSILSNLTDDNLIGSGGSGKVYRIASRHPGEFIAVKKIWNSRRMDFNLEKEFNSEVEILGSIRHANIVKLLCCISSEDIKLLVYEYMENQSLDIWLHRNKRVHDHAAAFSSVNNQPSLNWPMRLRIAIGAAQGLCYMHHDCSPPIIHRDIKSSNILLDSEFRATVADFGLAKMLVKHGEPCSLSAIAGSFGYIAPEYVYSLKVNEKVDVYSFGVVLLELVTGREANSGNENASLADWAWQYYNEGKPINEALDAEIKQACYIEEMSAVFKLGLACTNASPSCRPSMKDNLQILHRCCSQEGRQRKKMAPEIDVTHLIEHATYISSYKYCNGTNEDDESLIMYSV